MIDINELRRLAQAANASSDGDVMSWIEGMQRLQGALLPDDVIELLDRLEAAESARRDDYQNWMTALDRNAELLAKLEAAEKEREIDEQRIADLMAELNRVGHENDNLRVKIEQMEKQEPVAFGLYSGWALKAMYLKEHEACEQRDRRQLTADLGGSLEAYRVAPLYALPGAQPTPSLASGDVSLISEGKTQPAASVPIDSIGKLLTQAMDVAVSNGANSVSMPGELVEIAAWLSGVQPAPSINEGVRKVTLDFRWESEAQHHIPTIEIEFDPVSPGSPNDAKSWQDRDRLAAMLTPEAKP